MSIHARCGHYVADSGATLVSGVLAEGERAVAGEPLVEAAGGLAPWRGASAEKAAVMNKPLPWLVYWLGVVVSAWMFATGLYLLREYGW
ncbi:MAG: hypothetical protein KC503_19420 [Myxococcales bacterium]|nr:hypothetical protein [Myxococcales bacterium]